MSDAIGIAGERIRSVVERIEARRAVVAEVGGEDLDGRILKEIIRLRKLDRDARDEHETLPDVSMRAMDAPGPTPAAIAA